MGISCLQTSGNRPISACLVVEITHLPEPTPLLQTHSTAHNTAYILQAMALTHQGTA
jgi:hypothetical protein